MGVNVEMRDSDNDQLHIFRHARIGSPINVTSWSHDQDTCTNALVVVVVIVGRGGGRGEEVGEEVVVEEVASSTPRADGADVN